MTKKEVRKYIGAASRYDIDGIKLSELKTVVEGWISNYGEDTQIDLCGDDVEIEFNGLRLETDDEYEFRNKIEKQRSEQVEKYERQQYERLAAKYGV